MTFTRREVLRLAVAGLGAIPATRRAAAAQSTAVAPIPSWYTELRRLAPNVYPDTQATGPGVNNASLSNAGVVAGPDYAELNGTITPANDTAAQTPAVAGYTKLRAARGSR